VAFAKLLRFALAERSVDADSLRDRRRAARRQARDRHRAMRRRRAWLKRERDRLLEPALPRAIVYRSREVPYP
jgi:hypothetical protein